MRSMVERLFGTPKNPSTALRAVPLPRKSGGGFQLRFYRRRPICAASSLRKAAPASMWPVHDAETR